MIPCRFSSTFALSHIYDHERDSQSSILPSQFARTIGETASAFVVALRGANGHKIVAMVGIIVGNQSTNSGWNPPPLVIRAFGAHCQEQTLAGEAQ